MFLIVSSGRPYALLEAKLSGQDVSPSLRYFHERLKPERSLQVVRQLPGPWPSHPRDGVSIVSATSLLSRI